MKRSEMLEHIEAELLEFAKIYNISSEKAKSHKVRAYAENILSMLLGFGMLPPQRLKYIEENSNPYMDSFKEIYDWEPEDEA